MTPADVEALIPELSEMARRPAVCEDVLLAGALPRAKECLDDCGWASIREARRRADTAQKHHPDHPAIAQIHRTAADTLPSVCVNGESGRHVRRAVLVGHDAGASCHGLHRAHGKAGEGDGHTIRLTNRLQANGLNRDAVRSDRCQCGLGSTKREIQRGVDIAPRDIENVHSGIALWRVGTPSVDRQVDRSATGASRSLREFAKNVVSGHELPISREEERSSEHSGSGFRPICRVLSTDHRRHRASHQVDGCDERVDGLRACDEGRHSAEDDHGKGDGEARFQDGALVTPSSGAVPHLLGCVIREGPGWISYKFRH